MHRAKRTATATLLGVSLLLTACASTVRQPVSEADRDTSGVFDGQWIAHVSKAAKTQQIEQWVFTCPSEEYALQFVVNKGRLQLSDGATWVNGDGEFRLEVPSKRVLKESAGSGDSITGGEVTIILQGSLAGSSPNGYITSGIKQFGNNGCSAKVSYERRDATES